MTINNGIEVKVHTLLRDFIRQKGNRGWPHHLTMARLVARALRLGRPALIQTESSLHKYCLSYLVPVLQGQWSVIIVAPEEVLQRLQQQEIPPLQRWLGTNKTVRIGTKWQENDCILLTSPTAWLSDRLDRTKNFPARIPTIIDGADDLEEWTREQLTITLENRDWHQLQDYNPQYRDLIRQVQIQLTKSVFAHPPNRYECFNLEQTEIKFIRELGNKINSKEELTPKFKQFWHSVSQNRSGLRQKRDLIWVTRDRDRGLFAISLAPGEVAATLKPIWQQQPVVLIGSFLDRESKATVYREKLGLPEILTIKFAPNQQQDFIRLFIPDRFPLANTPEYSGALQEKIATLVGFSQNNRKFTVILVEDVPLRGQVASALAAKYGTIVKVDSVNVTSAGILVCGWQFWKQYQASLSAPQLLIMTTLPLPSLEHPLVASRVAHYKYKRQDWFRLYLLPTALKMIQQAIIPLRESQGMVALLDSRVNFRSYGKTILSVLEPCARINYIDPTWFLN